MLCSEFAWTDCREIEAGNKKGAHRILEQFRLATNLAIRFSLFPLWITDETKEGELFRPTAAVSLCYVCRQRVAPPPPPPKEDE